jgi:phospholipase A1/A2
LKPLEQSRRHRSNGAVDRYIDAGLSPEDYHAGTIAALLESDSVAMEKGIFMLIYPRIFCVMALYLIFFFPLIVRAEIQDDLHRCATIGDQNERLKCYDNLAQSVRQPPEEENAPVGVPLRTDRKDPSMFRHWELGESSGVFQFRKHKPIYILPARYTGNPNQKPLRALIPEEYSEDRDALDITDVETKFQLSFKLKMIEGLFSERVDVWLGYTQQSHWQVYNAAISRPFRETDYEPELMLVMRTNYDLLGLQGRFVNLGVVHQSNGRAEPLSRSWNRVYLQAGLESGGLGIYLRPWYRLQESENEDDNPDIDKYYGYGDLIIQYHTRGHTLAALLRGNPSEGNGAFQLDWTFPLYGPLRGYLQGFTGYGESLIDYNHEQTTIGVGLSFNDWF